MNPESLQKMIGRTSEPFILEVDRSSIKKFADAVGDKNPLYWNEEFARNTKYGSQVAPPGFFGWPVQWDNAMPFSSALRGDLLDQFVKEGYRVILDGGIEYDFNYPIRVGDILSSVVRIADIKEKESKGKSMFFSIIETLYTNQNGFVAAIARQTLISR
ncbi:MaoC family dehydratase N-terminal domain-containing protein [Neobacillus niacini]|uniref:FAS1-like dehydratase domain-containing protein n=1 Tax=Neobacillus niacini TaxID=86668 RepID=UPI002FFF1D33